MTELERANAALNTELQLAKREIEVYKSTVAEAELVSRLCFHYKEFEAGKEDNAGKS